MCKTLNPFALHHKLTQHCKATILQFKKKILTYGPTVQKATDVPS